MINEKQYIGEIYGRLTILSFAGRIKGKALCNCLCICGKTVIIQLNHLQTGNTKSCGCFKKTRVHGMSKTRIYSIWTQMFERCYRKTAPMYKYYGKRGIIVCDRWHEFNNFYEDMGSTYSDTLSIDRVNNDGNYCPENCRWATSEEQSFNKRSTIHLTINGITKTTREWALISPVTEKTIRMRLWWGRQGEDAVFTPLRANKRSKIKM